MLTQEELYINEEVSAFIRKEPELYQFNLSLLREDQTPPILHFCYHHLENYPNLMGQLAYQEYREYFAVNASIFYGFTTSAFVANGETNTRAGELAREEVKMLYSAYDELPLSNELKNFIKVVNQSE